MLLKQFNHWVGSAIMFSTYLACLPVNADDEHFVTIIKNGNGSGHISSVPTGVDCGKTCTGIYPHGTTVTLTAEPNEQATFEGWGGDCEGNTAHSLTMTLDADITCSATFSKAYACSGFKAPLDKVVEVEPGQILPFKAELIDKNGVPVTELHTPPMLRILRESRSEPVESVLAHDFELAPSEDIEFIFADNEWSFNLDTRHAAGEGQYYAFMLSGNEAEYTLEPTCDSAFVISSASEQVASLNDSASLLINLSRFEAQPSADGIQLTWSTVAEIDHMGYRIWRGTQEPYGGYTDITLLEAVKPSSSQKLMAIGQQRLSQPIPAQGSIDNSTDYSFVDSSAHQSGKTFAYLLESIDTAGKRTLHWDNITSATVE